MYTAQEYAGVLASTSICFDMSVFEIFATLAAGGKILLAENALALPDLAARDEVVLVDTVPSAMSELLRLGRLPSTIRTVNLGGEPLKGSLVREIHRQLPGVERVVNLYGPSEDTTFTSYAVVPRDAEHPSIGRPLTGEAAYVARRRHAAGADRHSGRAVHGRRRGDPRLPAPSGPDGGAVHPRPIRRRRARGSTRRGTWCGICLRASWISWGGSNQVKVRGFRIELGEIEAALRAPPGGAGGGGAGDAEEAGGNRLVAYVEPAREPSPRGICARLLKQRLPDYMVPSAFVLLRALPLTPNGKIDRRALPACPLHAARPAAAERRAPRNYVEELLAGIWSEVLRRER